MRLSLAWDSIHFNPKLIYLREHFQSKANPGGGQWCSLIYPFISYPLSVIRYPISVNRYPLIVDRALVLLFYFQKINSEMYDLNEIVTH